jgi:hypothetical protein
MFNYLFVKETLIKDMSPDSPMDLAHIAGARVTGDNPNPPKMAVFRRSLRSRP